MAYTEDDCIEAIREANSEVDGLLSETEYIELGQSPSHRTITRVLDPSWVECRKLAGIDPYGKETCIQSLQEANTRVDGPLSRAKYGELGISPTGEHMSNKFGSWNKAKEAAGLKLSSPNVNSNYFHEINDSGKAYWLGFFLGDGHVGEYRAVLALSGKDKDHLLNFVDTVESEYAVSESEFDGYTRISTSINDRKFIDGLEKHGVDYNKTDTSTVPSIPPQYNRDMIRGYFDADGNIRMGDGKRKWSITAKSKGRLENVRSILPVETSIYSGQEWYTLETSHTERIADLWGYLYSNGLSTKPKLERKATAFHGIVTDN